jgi:hypothetical protein
MDSQHFDLLVRLFHDASSRRGMLGLVLGGAVAPWFGLADIDAKKRKHKHKRKKRQKCKKSQKKCGKKCIPKTGCCTDADCEGDESCCAGQCTAPVFCNDQAVCGCDEVCGVEGFEYACQAGGCPQTDFCSDPKTYYCSPNPSCACATTNDGANACVDRAFAACSPCTSDDQCTESLGFPAVCLSAGPFCTCGGGASLCTALCTDDVAPRAAGRSGRSPLGKLKLAR